MEEIPTYLRGGHITPRRERARRSTAAMHTDPITLVIPYPSLRRKPSSPSTSPLPLVCALHSVCALPALSYMTCRPVQASFTTAFFCLELLLGHLPSWWRRTLL